MSMTRRRLSRVLVIDLRLFTAVRPQYERGARVAALSRASFSVRDPHSKRWGHGCWMVDCVLSRFEPD
eukprot:6487491-Prymnesium_polylepis.1